LDQASKGIFGGPASAHTDSEVEVTSWKSGVKNHPIAFDECVSDFYDTEWEIESSGDEVKDLEGQELSESLQKEIEQES